MMTIDRSGHAAADSHSSRACGGACSLPFDGARSSVRRPVGARFNVTTSLHDPVSYRVGRRLTLLSQQVEDRIRAVQIALVRGGVVRLRRKTLQRASAVSSWSSAVGMCSTTQAIRTRTCSRPRRVVAARIIAVLDERGLVCRARRGGALIRFAAADVSRIRNAELGRFTPDRLMKMLAARDSKLRVTIHVDVGYGEARVAYPHRGSLREHPAPVVLVHNQGTLLLPPLKQCQITSQLRHG